MDGRIDPRYGEIEIAGLSYDSTRVRPGDLFFAIPGAHRDGRDFVLEAVEAGASGFVSQRAVEANAPQISVASSLTAMNRLAAPFFGSPSEHLQIAGVTGTNGKTTTAYFLESIFSAAGAKAGLIGTIETRFPGGVCAPGDRTTPESIDLQGLLAMMVDADAAKCVMEVTSIGIERGRIEGTRFSAVAFTNLSQDHLDYHSSMERYYQAKRSLFSAPYAFCAAINIDDEYGARLAGETDLQVLTYGLERDAELRAYDIESGQSSSQFRILSSGAEMEILVPLPGRFNVYNALAAVATSQLMGIDPASIVKGIATAGPIPGRFERIERGQEFSVLVDYAHTPAGIQGVIGAAREFAPTARIILVFGCGGDRDSGKRPMMGQAAGSADVAIATSDNPRSEDPGSILQGIEQGLRTTSPAGGYFIVEDRREAIRKAFSVAKRGDVVIIAGKGHEAGQILAGSVIAFDDRLVAAEILEERTGK